MKKKSVDLNGLREAVLARAQGEALNIFNEERFGRFYEAEHVEALLKRASEFKILYVAHEAKLNPRLQALLVGDSKVEIRYLPVGEYDFKTEMLILGESVAVSDGDEHFVIDNASFAEDMRRMFFRLWSVARSGADERSGK